MNSVKGNDSMKVAIVQHTPVFLNLDQSLLKACDLIEEAANGGAEIIVFPETWLPGYPVWLDLSPGAVLWGNPPAKALYRILAENSICLTGSRIPGKHLDDLLRVAGETGTYVVMGAHERLDGTLYNAMIFMDRGGKKFQVHRKLVPTYAERLVWGRGDGSTLSVMETDHGILGGLICWEHWMPLARAAMHSKCEVIHVAQWPSVQELHQLASRHYAFEGQCYVLAAGTVLSRKEIIDGFHSLGLANNLGLEILEAIPDDDELVMTGGSAIIGPDSAYLVGPVYGETCILYAEIEPCRCTEGHLTLDTNGHYSRPDVFHLEVNDQPQRRVTFKSQQ